MSHIIILFCIIYLDYPRIPQLDLALVLSATALRSSSNFAKMKDIVNSVITRYGSFDISYSVLVFGDIVTEHVRFTDSFPDDKSLQERIKNIARKSGASLDKALDTAKNLLQSSPRPQAKKVFTITMFETFNRT